MKAKLDKHKDLSGKTLRIKMSNKKLRKHKKKCMMKSIHF